MIEIGFTKNMKNILRNIKGEQLVSLEYGKDPVENAIYGNFRLNFSEFSVEVTNEIKPQLFFGETEDMSGFECFVTEQNSPFKPDVVSDVQIIPVAENITAVEIATDEININQGEYSVSFDTSLIIRTTGQIFMFTRDVWFSEVMTISQNDDYNSVIPIKEVADSWTNEGEFKVNVKRIKEIL